MGNNKKLGNEFEKLTLRALDRMGAWAHFIQPNKGGQQPFDIIAVWNSGTYAIDCKTCKSNSFSISRLEENQIYAFQKFIKAGNHGNFAYVVVWHDNYAYIIFFESLIDMKSLPLREGLTDFEYMLNTEIQKILTEDELRYGHRSILR